MYRLINENIQAILKSLPEKHVTDYLWLVLNTTPEKVLQKKYKTQYGKFWGFQGMTEKVRGAYFQTLRKCLENNNTPPNLADGRLNLYQPKLYFSFATKLAHIVDVNHNLPIYDSMVAAFYFFKEPSKKKNETQEYLEIRVGKWMDIYHFLQTEYQRIQDQRLLDKAMEAFRKRFQSVDEFTTETFSNVKVIDSLIWACVKWLNSGVVVQGQVIYHK